MKISIFGYSGLIGNELTNYFLKKEYHLCGISRHYKIIKNKNFKFIKYNIENKTIPKRLIKELDESEIIIFAINKKNKPKNLKYDIDLLLHYNIYFPLKICTTIKKQYKKIILINSNSSILKKSNFPYTVSKTISKIFTTFSSQYLNEKIIVTSLIMNKFDKKKSKKLLETLDKICLDKTYFFNNRNIIIDSQDNIF